MLRRLVGLEAAEQRLFMRGFVGLPQPPEAEHQIVVGLHVFGVDGQSLLNHGDRFLVPAVEEQNSADLVQHHAVARILLADARQAFERVVVVAVGLLNHGEEKVGARQRRAELQRARDERARFGGFAFLDQSTGDVDPAVRIGGLDFGDAPESVFGALEIALQE